MLSGDLVNWWLKQMPNTTVWKIYFSFTQAVDLNLTEWDLMLLADRSTCLLIYFLDINKLIYLPGSERSSSNYFQCRVPVLFSCKVKCWCYTKHSINYHLLWYSISPQIRYSDSQSHLTQNSCSIGADYWSSIAWLVGWRGRANDE